MTSSNAAATTASRWLYVTPFAGQTRYDTAWWSAYWKRLNADGVPLGGYRIARRASAGVFQGTGRLWRSPVRMDTAIQTPPAAAAMKSSIARPG